MRSFWYSFLFFYSCDVFLDTLGCLKKVSATVALTGYFTLLVFALSCVLTLLPVGDDLIHGVLIPI